MNHLVVGIPTYKRPNMLTKLILSIYYCNLDPHYINKIDIVVVDNDAEKSGEKICLELKKKCPDTFNLHYFCYPEKGLSYVRNEILKRALHLKPNYIASIDDDEYVTTAWLNELTKTMVINDADIVLGPVLPDFETSVPKYISNCFTRESVTDQQQLKKMSNSGNYMIRTSFVIKYNLSFDPRFNTTGAEDTFFGVQAVKKGAKIFSAAKAIVYETIPKSRSTFPWLFKRTYRSAITYTYILILEKQYLKVLKKNNSKLYLFFYWHSFLTAITF
ncbi:glycosyltransferase [Zobellia nedashkovskayae]